MDALIKPAPHELIPSLARTRPIVALTSPVIYSLIIPFALADLWASFYQAICFPIYQIDQVRRALYFALDRAKLPYLNLLEKLNCTCCSYVNGVIAHVHEIAARTEQCWRPIKHGGDRPDPHDRYADFAAYGEAADLAESKSELRAALRSVTPSTPSQPAVHWVTPAVRPGF